MKKYTKVNLQKQYEILSNKLPRKLIYVGQMKDVVLKSSYVTKNNIG